LLSYAGAKLRDMATKKKSKRKSTKSKSAARKRTPTKAAKHAKKLTKKKAAPLRAGQSKASGKKAIRKKREPLRAGESSPKQPVWRLGKQSGDLQGLSRPAAADSESVDELLEEGNAFEADAVIGVENAEAADEKEVHTHEVPEDDVPGEYLDEQ
jgi:N utilization substance protein A